MNKIDELKKVIEETVNNSDNYLNELIYEIVQKIIEMQSGSITTIAELINYETEKSFVDPLTQGKVYNFVGDICKKINIVLEKERNGFGGLAYYYAFRKVDDNGIIKDELLNDSNLKLSDSEIENSNVIIRETYLDENGRERDYERFLDGRTEFPVVDKFIITQNIYNEIEKLPEGTEFTIQQFLKDYDVEKKDKFYICNLIFNLCENNNMIIEEKMPGADLGLPWNIPRIKKANSKKAVEDVMNKFLNEFLEKNEEIELRDNQKGITYFLQKNGENFYLKIEKTIKANDNINNLFKEIKKYNELVNSSNGFWPEEQEYPDLMILWEIITKFKNYTNKTNGALKYPDNWEQMISKINKEIISLINEK